MKNKRFLLLFTGAVVVLFAGSMFLLHRAIESDKAEMRQTAIVQARADYGCDEVEVQVVEGSHFKLLVCGKVRWYRCVDNAVKTDECSEVKKKK